jgi:hypothetical protein
VLDNVRLIAQTLLLMTVIGKYVVGVAGKGNAANITFDSSHLVVSTQTVANLSLLLVHSPTFRIQPFGSHPPTFGQAVMHHLHFPLPAALSFDHHPLKLLLFIILSTIFFISGVLFILGPLGHHTTSPACTC